MLQNVQVQPFSGFVYRVIAERYRQSPLSAIGSVRSGGRYNAPDTFPVLYCADNQVTALLEVEALFSTADGQLKGAPRNPDLVLSLRCELARVLDLTDNDFLEELGTSRDELVSRMNCQLNGRVSFRDLQFVSLDHETASSFLLRNGDLLFNRTNSIEHVGRMAIFDSDRPAVFASYLIRLSLNRELCEPGFLNHYMNQISVQRDIKRFASRAVGQANINASKLRAIEVPLPPTLTEQREIVAILDALDRKIDLHKQKRAVLEELFSLYCTS